MTEATRSVASAPTTTFDAARPRGAGAGRAALVIGLLAAGACLAIAASVAVGHASLADESLRKTLLSLRGYRTAAGFFAGASLAVGGLLVQGLFRNPLADPSMIGATAGATLGGTAALLLFEVVLGGRAATFVAPEMVLPGGCLAGAIVPLVILLAVTRKKRDRLVVLLTGFLLSSLCLSLFAFLVSLAQNSWELGRAVVRFSLGNLGSSGPRQVLLIAPLAVSGIVAAFVWGRPLDVLLSGEQEAESLGVDTRQVRLWCVVWTALLSAGAVAVGGGVGFVGLIVPHALRPFLGASHRRLVPAVALGGGAFVVLCDVMTRLSPGQGELPLGVVTGLVGAPVFMSLLFRSRREAA